MTFSHEQSSNDYPPSRRRRLAIMLGAISLVVIAAAASGIVRRHDTQPPNANITESQRAAEQYKLHQSITATMFWVGEPPNADNKGITNVPSAWVDDWVKEFGGIDDPTNRCGYRPCAFTPQENAFYFALPFNDYSSDGSLKPESVLRQIPWYSGPPPAGQSLVKNRWLAVTYNDKTAYGQWEDVGPFGEDDTAYVFGNAPPTFHAGLDLSPAINDYLGLDGMGKVSWRFVDAIVVPNGPWKQTITTSGLNH